MDFCSPNTYSINIIPHLKEDNQISNYKYDDGISKNNFKFHDY
jgi:hypothetical protein